MQRDADMIAAATTPPKLSTLVLLTALSVLSLNMFLPSLSNMAEDLETDYALVSLSIAGYLAITSFLQLIMGPLSDWFGRRPVLLAGLAIFSLASLVCAFATNIGVFLAFRLLQGAVISGAALSRAVIRDIAPEREAASMIGYVNMVMAIAPMLGPMLGGTLEQLFGWRASFVTFATLGIAVFGLCWVDLGETNKSPSQTLIKQFQTYPELLRSRRFWGYALCMTFSTGAFYSFLAGAPLVANELFAMSPAMSGFYVGTITAGFIFGSFLSGRYAQHHSPCTMMIAGRIVACTGLVLGIGMLLAGSVHAVSLFGATVFVGIGNGLTMPSSAAGALSVRPDLAGSASGLSGGLTVLGGAILTSITGAVVTKHGGAYTLLGMMLFCSAASLISALYVLKLDLNEAREPEALQQP